MGEVVEFDRGSEFHVSWTELSTYRQCPHKHELQYHDRWRTDKVAKPLALGIGWHEMLDVHYTGIIDNKVANTEGVIEWLVQYGAKDPEHPNYEYGQTLAWMYNGYRQRWGDREREWKIVKSESEMEFRLTVVKDGYEFVVHGRIDLLVEINGHLWVVDHKSGKALPHNKDLDFDDQTPTYVKGLREMGIPVRGAIFNNARTERLKRAMTLEERFDRVWSYRPDYELDYAMIEAAQDLTNAYNDDVFAPRHPDTQNCKWRCPYKEACLGGRKAPHLEVQLLEAHGFEKKPRRGRVSAND